MLFDKEQIPKAPPTKRMHPSDAGEGMIRFSCPHCGHDTGWIADQWTITENKRGQPCPVCNRPAPTTQDTTR
ncbi:hypothetical protein RPE78_09475 [Thioclava litoralis]|uniref:Zinc-ribbon domain-containing protein n=1 Tax=Thioclava litoralis TaxID=3076557 RepID=A0ABZ1DVZ3_9RHOB|nr:hypothetical protein RPE78_09475 [Thioclava sp. FTW29]